MAWLGWVAGIILIVAFYLVTLLTSSLLASIYEVNGIRHRKYPEAVKAMLVRAALHALWGRAMKLPGQRRAWEQS